MMDDVTQQNAALVEEASAAAQALTEQASSLAQLIARYKVGEAILDDTSRTPVPPPRTEAERRGTKRPWRDREKSATAKTVTTNSPSQTHKAAAAGGEAEWKDF
jgi:methyl-accepting chemotaxis protein